MMQNLDIGAIRSLSHSKLTNYILPGLDSLLLGATTRLFVNTRKSIGEITPHSHRFDFQCLVLQGSVTNTLFKPDDEGDCYTMSKMTYLGRPGEYHTAHTGIRWYKAIDQFFVEGDWYGMLSDEVHSIKFSNDAIVLFIEGRETTKDSIYLEPYINGETIPTMKTESWMFQKE
jgi:hypothetical protein